MMSSLTGTEWCIESLVFQKYPGKELINNCTLSKTESLSFLNTELAAFTKHSEDPGVLDLTMKKLDLNSDGQLNLQECVNLIGSLAVACHDSFARSTHF
uniref:EF-hand domain-containing protein n=1 Tax=Panthera leo TaxID=9689 RepID=A0A8C9D4X3_PANLE